MKIKYLAMAVIGLGVSSFAHAESQKISGFYLGGALGNTTFDADTNISGSEDGGSFKFIAGYQFGRVFALEGQYTSYGDIDLANTTWSASSISLNANLGYTMDNGIRPYGTIGVGSITIDETVQTLSEDTGGAAHYGFGVEYAPPSLDGLAFRIGYEADIFTVRSTYWSGFSLHTEDVDYDIGSFHAGVTYKF